MNHYEDVFGLNRDERQIANLGTYQRFISKGDKCLDCIIEEDRKEIKEVLKGVGKLLAIVDGRRTMAGNHKYVLFVKVEGGVKVYLYTVLNGLYNEMGPFKDLDTAMSNADCYGLFEECKKVANEKPLNEADMKDGLFKQIYESVEDEEYDDWDDLGYDDPDAGVDDEDTFYGGQEGADFYDGGGYDDNDEWMPAKGRVGYKSSDKEIYAAETAGADDGYYAGDMLPDGKDREYEDGYDDFHGFDWEDNFDPENPSTITSYDDANAFGGKGRTPNNDRETPHNLADPYGVSDAEKETIDWNTITHGYENVDYGPEDIDF